jgi:hypothetical protein
MPFPPMGSPSCHSSEDTPSFQETACARQPVAGASASLAVSAATQRAPLAFVMFVIRAVTTYVGLALGHSGCNPDASQILSAGFLSRPLTLAHVGEPPVAGAVCCIGTHDVGTPGSALSLAASPLPLVVTGGARHTGDGLPQIISSKPGWYDSGTGTSFAAILHSTALRAASLGWSGEAQRCQRAYNLDGDCVRGAGCPCR